MLFLRIALIRGDEFKEGEHAGYDKAKCSRPQRLHALPVFPVI
jgi:hypothetical protein